MRKRRITQFMDFVLVREDYDLAKPHPEPYLAGLARFGAAKPDTLVVEDSVRGLRSAMAAGIDCAVVDNGFAQGGDFSGASHRIERLIDLVDIIDRGE
jgi:beta-phosphoglucomutase-like phosphatase (HAD superfamily)